MISKRTVLLGLISFLLFLPVSSAAKYTYLGNVLQPLANIDPVVDGQAFKVWGPDSMESGLWSVGTSAEFLRKDGNKDDIDTLFSLTGAYSLSDRMVVGGIIPYIIRDPEFNESDLLDVRAFARYRFTGDDPGSGMGAELLASFPTAAQGGSYPLTLDTTLIKFTLAAAGILAEWHYGLNLGYQSYLESEAGDDFDLNYGFYTGRKVSSNTTGVLEYSASKHTHSEGSFEEEITDATVLVGLKYRAGDNLTFGFSIGSGLSDSYADLRSQATLLWLPGRGKDSQVTPAARSKPEEPFAPEPPRVLGGDLLAAIKPGKGGVLVQVSNRSGIKRLGEKASRHLEKSGYAVPVVEEGSGDKWERSYIYYSDQNRTAATEIKLLFGRPESLIRVPSSLKGVGVLIVLGEDLADW